MTSERAAEICQYIKFILKNEDYTEEVEEALDMAIEALDQEKKRGKWIDVEDQLGMQCSECGKMCSEITLRTDMMTEAHWNYCPKCGAKMKGEDDEID